MPFEIIEINENDEIIERDGCINCGEETIVPDDRTGLIHAHGRYGCFTLVGDKEKWMGTVAE